MFKWLAPRVARDKRLLKCPKPSDIVSETQPFSIVLPETSVNFANTYVFPALLGGYRCTLRGPSKVLLCEPLPSRTRQQQTRENSGSKNKMLQQTNMSKNSNFRFTLDLICQMKNVRFGHIVAARVGEREGQGRKVRCAACSGRHLLSIMYNVPL